MNNEDLRLVLFNSKMSRIEIIIYFKDGIWEMFPCTLMLTICFCPVRNYQKLKYLPKIRSFRAPDESYRYYNTGKHSERRLVVQLRYPPSTWFKSDPELYVIRMIFRDITFDWGVVYWGGIKQFTGN